MGHLPQRYRSDYKRIIKSAHAMNSYAAATCALKSVVGQLERIDESAAWSLEEGLEVTLTLYHLGIPDVMWKSFSSTNLIESAFSHGASVMGNVK
ncbi:MAG: hypothetical protein JXA06_02715 [Bacteroidetes bacterium]|nr:hypothetical protein [Bacteroidota bacterium]